MIKKTSRPLAPGMVKNPPGHKKRLFAAIFVIIISALSAAACSGPMKPKDMNVALTLTDRAVNYALQGQVKMADYTYNRAIAKFRDMGRFCDMARVAILIYTIDREGRPGAIDDAKAFATLGGCREETDIVNFLSGGEYNLRLLQEPYKAYAEFQRTGSLAPLRGLVSSSQTSDKIKSLTYRMMARALEEKNPEAAVDYAEKAKNIDSTHAWTKNILEDENVILKAYRAAGLPTDIVSQRINVLKQALEEKY